MYIFIYFLQEIQIGPDHQAEVPEVLGPNYQDGEWTELFPTGIQTKTNTKKQKTKKNDLYVLDFFENSSIF